MTSKGRQAARNGIESQPAARGESSPPRFVDNTPSRLRPATCMLALGGAELRAFDRSQAQVCGLGNDSIFVELFVSLGRQRVAHDSLPPSRICVDVPATHFAVERMGRGSDAFVRTSMPVGPVVPRMRAGAT